MVTGRTSDVGPVRATKNWTRMLVNERALTPPMYFGTGYGNLPMEENTNLSDHAGRRKAANDLRPLLLLLLLLSPQ